MASIDTALQAAVLWFAAGTLVLIAVGKAAVADRAARLAMTLAVGAVLAGLARLMGLDPAAEVEVGVAVMVLCLVGPARWHAGGAIFWGGLVASTGVYLIYLVRATFLLGSTLESATPRDQDGAGSVPLVTSFCTASRRSPMRPASHRRPLNVRDPWRV